MLPAGPSSVGEWLQAFRPVWDRWAARLAVLQPDDADELASGVEDASLLKSLLFRAQCRSWDGTTCTVACEQAFSGLAAVASNCMRLAQLVEQGAVSLQDTALKSLQILSLSLSCLQLCPWENLHATPAALQQQRKALWQFYFTAGPQLLLDALVQARRNGSLSVSKYLRSLADELQGGARVLLQPPLTKLLKRSERSSLVEGVGRLLDVLERATREGGLDVWPDCAVFGATRRIIRQEGRHYPPSLLLLEVAAAKPSWAALAFRYFAGGVLELARDMQHARDAVFEQEDEIKVASYFLDIQLSCVSTYLDSFVTLDTSFRPSLLSEAVASDLPLLGEICAALSALSEQVESDLCRPAASVGRMVDARLLRSWADAWAACTNEGLDQHIGIPHVGRILVAAGSMVRVAAALGGWQQEGRSGLSSSRDLASLQEELPSIWSAARYLATQALTCVEQLRASEGEAEAALTALQRAVSVLGDVTASLQGCHRSCSSRSRDGWGTELDPRLPLLQMHQIVAMTIAWLASSLQHPGVFQPLCSINYPALLATLSLGLQVQAKAAQALETYWDVKGGIYGANAVLHLSDCLFTTLKLVIQALNLQPDKGGPPAEQCGLGGCSARLAPAVPYLHTILAAATLLRLGKQQPAASDKLRQVLCWLLASQGSSALHAGTGQLLLSCCTEPGVTLNVLRELRACGEAAAALGAIPLLERVAERLGARDQGDMQAERQLSMDASSLLKRCCTIVDEAAGTSFAAIDAEIEAEGAQLMRDLLLAGQPNAADTVRAHVWQRRAELLLPRLAYVVRCGCGVMACSEQAPCSSSSSDRTSGSSNCGSGSSGSGQVLLCPRVAIDGELEWAGGRACSSPTCCIVLVAEGSKLLVCRGCQVAHYCSASCAQADWQRHRPLCNALRRLKSNHASKGKGQQQAG